jgi:hypothetical protein
MMTQQLNLVEETRDEPVSVNNVTINDTELVCPICGCSNLHHGRVITYSRVEDNKYTTVVESNFECQSSQERLLPSEEINNPSGRRDGLAVDFGCGFKQIQPERWED